jgi:DNA-binding transcriptional MocR family regulator
MPSQTGQPGPSQARISAGRLARLIPAPSGYGRPRYAELSDAISSLLLDGRLAPGTRLPSERGLAASMDVSRTTVTSSYDALERAGLLRRMRGSGSFLRLPGSATVGGPGSRINISNGNDDIIDLSIACLPATEGLIEAAAVRAAAAIAAYTRHDGYHAYGLQVLRDLLAQRYRDRGVPTGVDNILITNGAQHGIDIVLRALAAPGERVIIELPTYPGAIEAIQANGALPLAVPLTDGEGWPATAFAAAVAQHSPRLLYLIPDFHNPTGILMTDHARELIVDTARRSNARVVVDESFIDLDLRPPGSAVPTPMAAVHSSVISLGSLSKPIWGGLRIGWIRADADTIHRLAMTRARGDMSGPVMEQLVTVELFGDIDSVATQRRIELRQQRDVLINALAQLLPSWTPTPACGGMSTWVRLNAPMATTLTRRLEERGVLLSPGSRFAPNGVFERFVRLPFALDAERLTRAVELIAATWTDLDGAPATRNHLVPL